MHPTLSFASDRIREILHKLERMAAGETSTSLPISPMHDELDAIVFGINVLAEELRWTHERVMESERVKADALRAQAIRLSGDNFATSFHANPCAMTITRHSDGRFKDVNESFERQTGFHRDEVIGRTAQEFGMWIDPDDLAAFGMELSSAGKVRSREVRLRTKSGAPSTALYTADIITFCGERCVLAVGLDVTDLKNAEIKAATLREELAHLGRATLLEALAGSFAHEITQPLTAVMANAEAALRLIAAEPPRLGELRETLNEILRANQCTVDVLQRIRTLLKKGAVRYEPIEVNAIVSDVVRLIQAAAAGRRIALDVALASDIAPVLGDRVQIQQVVLNLLMNAFDAVQDCAPANRRVCLRTSPRDLAAIVEVRDHGSGMSDEALTHIFEPFYTTKQNGMGLGLSISRAIVEAHGGTLDAMRNPGTGMTFAACFPLRRS